MRFKQFVEFAVFDFTPALIRVSKYMAQAKAVEPHIGHPIYHHTKPEMGIVDKTWMAYWQALTEFEAVIKQYLHENNILKTLTPLYKKWKLKFEEMERKDQDARHVIDHNRMTTNLFLLHEMIVDMAAGKSPEA
jgi:hypothetical protein